MRALFILCSLLVAPAVSFADPADLPNANLPGNSATLPNSNLPGSVSDDRPVQLPNTDPPPSVYCPAWWWPPPPERAEQTARAFSNR